MYGLWGYLLKEKALAPINARRVLEGGWYVNTRWHIEFGRPVFQEEKVLLFLQFRSIYPFLRPKCFWALSSEKLCSVCRKMFSHGHVIWPWMEYPWAEGDFKMFWYKYHKYTGHFFKGQLVCLLSFFVLFSVMRGNAFLKLHAPFF